MYANAKMADLINHARADEQPHSYANHRYADGGSQTTQPDGHENIDKTDKWSVIWNNEWFARHEGGFMYNSITSESLTFSCNPILSQNIAHRRGEAIKH